MKIFINGRALTASVGGVRRYTEELCTRLKGQAEVIVPAAPQHGMRGHLWEQLRLPLLASGLLWSPANTGPLWMRRQVVTIHDAATIDHPEWFAPNFARWYGWLLPRLARRALHVITDSEFSKGRIMACAGLDSGRISVVYPGVSCHFYPRSVAESQEAVAKLCLPSKDYVLSLSTQEPRKNLPALLKAWAAALPSLPETLWLVLTGPEGKMSVFSDANVDELPPRVWRTGLVADPDLPALYSGARLFVFPSLYEGFGIPPLEAMACGTPVISSGAASLREVVGSGAHIIEPTDISALAAALVRLIQAPAELKYLSDAGRERATHFTWEACSAQTLEILRAAAKPPEE